MGQYGTACPKPEPRKRVKDRRKRQESAVEQLVRALCVARDGDCRVPALLGPCLGESEWAHLGDLKRFKTRGKPAEERHTTAGSLMLCSAHHAAYDTEHTLTIEPFCVDKGADGTLRMQANGISVLSVPR